MEDSAVAAAILRENTPFCGKNWPFEM